MYFHLVQYVLLYNINNTCCYCKLTKFFCIYHFVGRFGVTEKRFENTWFDGVLNLSSFAR